jgi:AcrR family transcriptional regulator
MRWSHFASASSSPVGTARRLWHYRVPMARTPDPLLKLALLDEVVGYLAATGLGVSSLRPMALALGVSTHRLVHHFGSKAELVDLALRRALSLQEDVRIGWMTSDPGLSQADLLRLWWEWMLADPANLALVRLGFEAVCLEATVTGLERDIRAEQIGVWRSSIEDRLLVAGLEPQDAALEASTTKAFFSGLVMDLLATGDVDRLTEALEYYLSLRLDRLPGAHSALADGASVKR